MCVCNISIYKNTNTLTYIHIYIQMHVFMDMPKHVLKR